VALAVGSIGMILPPAITPSIAQLTVLVDNLVQLGQVQVSDLMPLDHDALDAVAVLLVVSAGPAEESIDTGIGWHEGAGAGAGASAAVVPLAPRAESLERFLLDLDGSQGAVPQDVLQSSGEPTGSSSEWAWQPSTAASDAVGVPRGPRPRDPGIGPRPRSLTAPDREPDAGDEPSAIPLFEGESRRPGSKIESETDVSDRAWPIRVTLLMSSLSFAGWAAWCRRRGGGSRRIGHPLLAMPARKMGNRPRD
jgi:hypothetical protein